MKSDGGMCMILQQHIIDRMERCYSVGSAEIDGKDMIFAASEAKGGGFCLYSAKDFRRRETVWGHGGGTMAVVPVPGEKDTLYAVRNFFPGFDAAGAEIVCCRKVNGEWKNTPVLQLPYLHRFDLFQIGEKRIFLGSTLCTSKNEREDWSDPGKVYTGFLGEDVSSRLEVAVLAEGLVKNHGYWRGLYQGKQAGYVASENGVFVFVPGKTKEQHLWKKIWDHSVSEAALFDLDGCGKEELIAIEPFHGNQLNIYKAAEGKYERIYTYPGALEFVHALWTGIFSGKPAVICGARKLDQELFMVTYGSGGFCTTILDKGSGSANVCVFEKEGRQYILSANHARGEVAVYSEE